MEKTFKWGWEATQKVRELAGQFTAGRALDLGCGCGGNALFLAEQGFQTMAIDRQSEAIACARERAKEAGLTTQVETMETEVMNPAVFQQSYNTVLAVNILQLLKTEEATLLLERIRDAMEPNGTVFIRVFSDANSTKARSDGWYRPSPDELKAKFVDWEILYIDHFEMQDDHPPTGPHTHWILDLLAKKP